MVLPSPRIIVAFWIAVIVSAHIQTGSVGATAGRLGWAQQPLGQRASAPLFVNLAGDEMALPIEMVVNLGMDAAPFRVRNHRAGKAGRKQ